VADKTLRRQLHGYALSPDGSRIAQLESSRYFTKKGYEDAIVYDVHLVIRDLRGGLLHEFKEIDNGKEVTATVAWPADTAGPVVHAPNLTLAEGHERWLFDPALKLLAKAPYREGMLSLGGERRLVRDGAMLLYHDTAERIVCRIGPFTTAPSFATVSRDGSHLATLDEYGRLQIFATQDGRRLADTMVPELGSVLAFTPDGSQLVLGGARGTVLALGLDGTPVWSRELASANTVLGGDLPERDPSFPDLTARLWPETRDEPGQLEKLVRLGPNRLVNGDAEEQTGWQAPQLEFRGPGQESSRSLVVGAAAVTQEVSGYLGTHATWVLEFFYRSADATTPVELLAGLKGDGRFRESTAVRLSADPQWRFARVAFKNGENCRTLTVGFSAAKGDCLVDRVSLRQIRFPSINHLLSEPLYAVEPVVLENPLYAEQYDPVGNLREQAVNRVLIPPLHTGALNLVENAWMQNGRLNDTSDHWFLQPFSRESPELPISLSLREPRWISLLAVSFNQRRPDQVAPHFDVYAVDPETGDDRLLASVRNNAQVFRLVRFAPIKTTLVKLVLVNSIERHRTLSEIELYGPLSGREGQPAFLDPEGQNTYMGDFTRVDKRRKPLADDYLPPLVRSPVHDEAVAWHAPITQPLMAEGRMYLGRTFGQNTSHTLAEPLKDVSWGRAGGFGYTPYGTLYAGLILRTGNDGKLYCLNPDTGTELWSAPLGSRLFGCPVCIGEDIYVASDVGKLFQLDLASGQIMKEAPIGGLVLGSLATDGRTLLFITDDGRLNAVDAATFKTLWQLPIAAATDSTPAVDQGTVYLADQQGLAQAVDLATGRPRWATPLEDEFARCPVVGPDVVVFGCRGGTLAALDRATGKIRWKQRVDSRFEYEPLLTESGLLAFSDGTAMLMRLDTGASTPWQTTAVARGKPALLAPPFTLPNDPVVPLSYYRGRLAFIERPADKGHQTFQMNFAWHLLGGSYTVLAPFEPAAAEAKP
jgi:outer membrane protein assembly factor BamB